MICFNEKYQNNKMFHVKHFLWIINYQEVSMIYLDNTELPVILALYDYAIDSVLFSDNFLIYDFG